MGENEARAAVEAAVSADAFQTLETFVGLVRAWTGRTNLVSAADADRLWSRHVLDCLQVAESAPMAARTWIDLGAGAGFPGLVAAIVNDHEVTLVESNKKKAAFLWSAIAATKAPAKVVTGRIEAVPAAPHDVVSARALAPLSGLFALAHRFFAPHTVGLFPKGREAAGEIAAAREGYDFTAEALASRTDAGGAVLRVTGLRAR